MQELTLVFAVLALAVSAYAAFMLTRLLRSVESLTDSLDKSTQRLQQLDGKVAAQEAALKALQEQLAAKPAAPHVLDFVPQLMSGSGKSTWGPVVALGLKLFTAYWKKRQGKETPKSAKNKSLEARNATGEADVSKANRS